MFSFYPQRSSAIPFIDDHMYVLLASGTHEDSVECQLNEPSGVLRPMTRAISSHCVTQYLHCHLDALSWSCVRLAVLMPRLDKHTSLAGPVAVRTRFHHCRGSGIGHAGLVRRVCISVAAVPLETTGKQPIFFIARPSIVPPPKPL